MPEVMPCSSVIYMYQPSSAIIADGTLPETLLKAVHGKRGMWGEGWHTAVHCFLLE
jgi:hypothetical protein